jgi:hypothetical protein
MRIDRRRLIIASLTALVGIAALYILPMALAPMPSSTIKSIRSPKDRITVQDGHIKLQNDIRTTMVQAIGGLLLIVGAVTAWKQLQVGQQQLQHNFETTKRSLQLDNDRQITEQFGRAIDHLGTDNINVRLGGIYTLERLLSSEQIDYRQITEILVAYIRHHAYWAADEAENFVGALAEGRDPTPPRTRRLHERLPDVQAVIDVLGRQPGPRDDIRRSILLFNVDLGRAILARGNFRSFTFINANLGGCQCQGGDFRKAAFRLTDFGYAEVGRAQFQQAAFARCSLRDVRGLEAANLQGVRATGTVWPTGFDWKAAGVTEVDRL